jgi:hypothetical protein
MSNWREIISEDLSWFIADQELQRRDKSKAEQRKMLKRNWPNVYMALIRHPNQL